MSSFSDVVEDPGAEARRFTAAVLRNDTTQLDGEGRGTDRLARATFAAPQLKVRRADWRAINASHRAVHRAGARLPTLFFTNAAPSGAAPSGAAPAALPAASKSGSTLAMARMAWNVRTTPIFRLPPRTGNAGRGSKLQPLPAAQRSASPGLVSPPTPRPGLTPRGLTPPPFAAPPPPQPDRRGDKLRVTPRTYDAIKASTAPLPHTIDEVVTAVAAVVASHHRAMAAVTAGQGRTRVDAPPPKGRGRAFRNRSSDVE
jgi:hypothetical protein